MKQITCFCGDIFDNLSFRYHVKNCEVYQIESKKYLTYDNFYHEYMIKRKPCYQFFKEEPYCHCRPVDLSSTFKQCNFPKLIRLGSGKMVTKSELDNLLNKDFLYDCYVNKCMSANQIAKSLNIGIYSQTILARLQKLGIKRRSIKDAMKVSDFRNNLRLSMKKPEVRKKLSIKAKSKETRDKYKRTCLQRFGYECPNKNEKVKIKTAETFFKNHKVHTLPQLLAKRGISNNTKSYSNISLKLFQELCNYFPDYCNCFKFYNHGDETMITINNHSYYLDFSYNKDNIKFDIEFNGDYWHANPKLYRDNYLVNTDINTKVLAKDIWLHDEKRKSEIESVGYNVLTVWEYDFRNEPEKVIQECCNFIKSNLRELKIN